MTDQVRERSRAPGFVAHGRWALCDWASFIRSSTTTLLATVLLMACSSLGSGPTGSPATTLVESPLVGTWQTTITKDDLRSAGVSDPGLLNENAGRFTRTFLADGTWTIAQESLDGSPIHNPAGRGSYTVLGNELRLQIEFPPEFQGTERYRWAVDGSELRLTMLEPDDFLARLGAETHPWTRTTP